jgi:hypothetical protein
MTEVDSQKLKTQIEYYLSDANLKVDKFFHHKISSAKDVRIPSSNRFPIGMDRHPERLEL